MPAATRETSIIHDLSPPDGTPEAELVTKYPEIWDMLINVNSPERNEIISASLSAQTQAEAMRLAYLGIGVLRSVESRMSRITHINDRSHSPQVSQRSKRAAG